MNSKFSISDIILYINEIDIPNFEIVSGKFNPLDINLNVLSDLDIDGNGSIFVLKTLNNDFDVTFSPSKGIYDLDNSFLQLANLQKLARSEQFWLKNSLLTS